MRLRSAPFAALAVAASLLFGGGPGCSSDDPATAADTGPNKCVASGATCALNFPFVCAPGFEPVASGDLATACGKDEGSGKQMPCCVPSAPTDTGVDTGSDTGSGDGGADAAGDAAPDGGGDAAKDATGDATGDASDAGGGG